MEYSVVFSTILYSKKIAITNPTKLQGWSEVFGVPYWVLGHAHAGGDKWRAHRRDKLFVNGDGGFWHGMAEDNEFFIQDNDFERDPRFAEGMKKYHWVEPEKKEPRKYRQERLIVGVNHLGNNIPPPEWQYYNAPAGALQPAVAPNPPQPAYQLDEPLGVAAQGLREANLEAALIRYRVAAARPVVRAQDMVAAPDGAALVAAAHPPLLNLEDEAPAQQPLPDPLDL